MNEAEVTICRLKEKGMGVRLGWIAALALAFALAGPAAALPQDLVPRGSWIYDGLASLAARGLVPGVSARSLHGDELRPRVELARLTVRQYRNALADLIGSFRQEPGFSEKPGFFGGLTHEEIATILDCSPRTVNTEWALARAWLHRELKRG